MRPRLWWNGLAALALLASAVALVAAKHQAQRLFVESQELQREQDRLNVEWNMLQLEQAAWATHGRIEQLARKQLNMRIPGPDDVVILNARGRS